MRTAIELLRELEQHIERSDNEGYVSCPCCAAQGWGFLEHAMDCPVREARALLGKCPHGYQLGYDHGSGPCGSK
jgi:hypothetical protein